MKKIKFSILILFSNLLLLLFSCNIQDLRCHSKDDNTIIHNQTIAFTYQSNTEEFIDINNDQINDFKCISERAGNRIRKLIVPIGTENKIISTDNILGIGEIIDKHKTFSDRFDFNDLGAGSNAHLDHKFIGVAFKIKQCTHYGWIEFSSSPDGGKNSNTPIYYHKVSLVIHNTGFNAGYNKAIVTLRQ